MLNLKCRNIIYLMIQRLLYLNYGEEWISDWAAALEDQKYDGILIVNKEEGP